MAEEETQETEVTGAPAPEKGDAAVSEPVVEAASAVAEKPKRTRARKAATEVIEEVPAVAPPEPVEPVAAVVEPARPARAKAAAKANKAEPATPEATATVRGTYVRTPAGEPDRGRRRERRGVVVSDKGDKTITIRVDTTIQHPKYHKVMKRSMKLRVHDEGNEAHVGDKVRVIETRPLSRSKRWRLLEIVEVAR